MNTLEELLTELTNKGLRIRILSEREVRVHSHLAEPTKWVWWCQLAHQNGFVDSENGDTMFTAIANAIERAKGNRGPDNRPMNSPVIVHKTKPVQETPAKKDEELDIDLDDLIGAPKKKINLDDLI